MELPSFDELVRLAKDDPQALEDLRSQMIEDTISKAPADYHRRLRGLQFQIDAVRKCSSTPMSACLKISRMMHDQLHVLRDTINGENEVTPIPQASVATSSKIVQFPLLANS